VSRSHTIDALLIISGNAINRPTHLNLKNATTHSVPIPDGTLIAVGGLYAPTIRYDKGKFYIICTNVLDGQFENFYITCNDIWANSWRDPIPFDFHGIDPSLFFDDDGRVYVQGSHVIDYSKQPSCIIKQFEIDIQTGKPLTEQRDIWEGHAKIDPEGPHMYKRGTWYYLMIAEGGTFKHHMLSIARSRNVWGPFESYEKNPILTADGTSNEIQNVGHGELFQDDEGLWWAAVLGVRNRDGRYPLGRETFLTPVDWPSGGWPSVEPIAINMERASKSLGVTKELSTQPGHGYIYIRDAIMDHHKFQKDNRIVLTASDSNLSTPGGTTTFVGLRQPDIECTTTATLFPENLQATAGLAVYKDDYRHAEVFFDPSLGAVCFTAKYFPSSGDRVITTDIIPNDQIQFAIHATETQYDFRFRQSAASEWHSISTLDTKLMTANDFTGTLFGIYASGRGEAAFGDFKVEKKGGGRL
jgi:beta-xylosidase